MRKDKTKQSLFIQELVKAKFLCPIQIDAKKLKKTDYNIKILNEDTEVALISITNKTGEQYLMAFTDENEFQKWNPDKNQQTLIFSFEDYKRIVLSEHSLFKGFVLNPFGDNIVLNSDILENIYSQQTEIKKNHSIMIGLPKEYPTLMIEHLIKYFQKTKSIMAAYLLWMVNVDESSYLLVLDTKISLQELFPKINEICQPYLGSKLLDVVDMGSELGKTAIENQKPFYVQS